MEAKEGFQEILPPDCLYEIFTKLEDEKQTLFRCMLTSRDCCRQIAPILWSFPLRSLSSEASRRFVPSFLACLFEEEKSKLTSYGIPIPQRWRPVFDYHTFIKELDVENLEKAVAKWLKVAFPRDSDDDLWIKVLTVATPLCRLIFRTSAAFESLRIEKTTALCQIPDFTMFLNAPKALTQLKRFELGGWQGNFLHKDLSNITELFTAMKLMTRDLESLQVDFQNINNFTAQKLTDLITLQNALHYITFINFSDEFGIVITGLMSKQANYMKRLVFKSSHFFENEPTYLENLQNFKVLETLIFEECRADIESIEWWSSLARGPMSLRRLYFDIGGLNGQVLVPIITHAKHNFQELVIRQECSNMLFNAITESSRNIISLAVAIDGSAVVSFMSALAELRQLEQLVLRQSLDGGTPISLEIWPKLAKTLPRSLRYLFVDFNEFSADSLALFLQTRQTPIRQIGFGNAEVLGSGHLVLLLYYAREKAIVRKVGFSNRLHKFRYSHFNSEILQKAKEYIEFVDVVEFDKSPEFLGMSI
ncbi:hypothetical protein G9A89_020302 [Geosiphon pyriformis]|nr:hypothetical protein G9A89_020302 [Geosiphon pyriformis]